MSRTATTLIFTLRWFLNQARYWADKLYEDINLDPVMPDEDKNFHSSLVLHFGIWLMASRENDLYEALLMLDHSS